MRDASCGGENATGFQITYTTETAGTVSAFWTPTARYEGYKGLGTWRYPSASTGMNGVAILAETHVMVQTWPLYGYIAVDILTCGQHTDPNLAVPMLRRFFAPTQIQVIELNSGIMEGDDLPASDTDD